MQNELGGTLRQMPALIKHLGSALLPNILQLFCQL